MLKSSVKFSLKNFEEKEINIDLNNNQTVYCLLKIKNKKCKFICTSCYCCLSKVNKINLCHKIYYKNYTILFINIKNGEKFGYDIISNFDFKIAQLPQGEYLILLFCNGIECFKFNIILNSKNNIYKFEFEV